VIEVAVLELVNDLPTGRHFHHLIDPSARCRKRQPHPRVHTRGPDRQARFAEIASDLMAFLGEGMLVAHNAPFDFGFLNAEFAVWTFRRWDPTRMIDTLRWRAGAFPGMPNSLDALCRRV